MYNVLLIDTETTGLHPLKGAVTIEIAALLYNVKHRVVTQTLSTFLPCDINEVEHINGIKSEWTRSYMDVKAILDCLVNMSLTAEAIVAHNAQFDKTFLQTNIPDNSQFWTIPWVCTKNDFQWPVSLPRNRLQDVCEAMGVQYIDAHRALTDCKFIAGCFNKVVDLENRLLQSLRRK